MSSAILYVAIVAIWAGVLIPRWLRRDSSAEEREDDEAGPADTETVPSPVPAPSVPAAPAAERPAPGSRLASGSRSGSGSRQAPGPRQAPAERGVPAARAAARRSAAAPAAGPAGATGPREERPEILAGDEPSEERRKVLAARRRLLGMVLALALGSCVLAFTKLAAWWVVVPPVTMLTGYLALLREASKADAERRELAHARAAEAASHQAAPPATATAPVAPPPAPPVPDAEVIDISASVGQGGKEFYDQYADAKLRAVGDLPLPAAAQYLALLMLMGPVEVQPLEQCGGFGLCG